MNKTKLSTDFERIAAFPLQYTMRWFGPSDPVPLPFLAQAGCQGVVTALHDLPIGAVWGRGAIRDRRALIEAAGMEWKVVESLPVHEHIKTRTGEFKTYISAYKKSLRHLAEAGIEVVTYNFMPVMDWVRTNLSFTLPTGAKALRYNHQDYAVFELFQLQRSAARDKYSLEEIQNLEHYYQRLSQQEKNEILQTALLALPGSDEAFTPELIKRQLATYQNIDRQQLKAHLYAFLNEICPVAEEVGIQLAIHPDDPPFSVLGLPRILSSSEDIKALMQAVPSTANGLCFCTGSLAIRPENNLIQILQDWGHRVNFLHLRNIQRGDGLDFMEAPHLDGEVDMYAILKEVLGRLKRENKQLPIRPDHGHQILDDLNRKSYPGYAVIGRLKGLAEIRGLSHAVWRDLGA